jgi:Predicted integral membrane protein
MIILGQVFRSMPPKNINHLSGYRTKRSMLSQDTWQYANRRCGYIYFLVGFVFLVFVVISQLFIPISIERLSLINLFIGILVLLIPIPIVEKELKDNFDNYGNKI